MPTAPPWEPVDSGFENALDVHMAMLMLPEEFTAEQRRANFEFYEARTLHESSLSPAIHIASATGTRPVLAFGFGGLRARRGRLTFDPWLPPLWRGLRFRLRGRGHRVVHVNDESITLTLRSGPGEERTGAAPETVSVAGREVDLALGVPTKVARHPAELVEYAHSHATTSRQGES